MNIRVMAIALLVHVALLPAAAARAKVTDEEIQAALDSGIAWLLDHQTDRGWWSPNGAYGSDGGYPGAYEAYAMLALAYADVSLSNPKMKKGVDALLEFKPNRTYVSAPRIMTLAKLLKKLDRERQERARAVIRYDANFLLATQKTSGGWGYPHYTPDTDPDLAKLRKDDPYWDFSNTQLGMLGLSEAINAGLELPLEPFKKAMDLYLAKQNADGGWGYGTVPGMPFDSSERVKSYGSMSAAAVASLLLARDYLNRDMGCPCSAGRSNIRTGPVDQAIERGLEWLGKNFVPDRMPGPASIRMDAWLFYYLYACERVGLASGMKYFGSHDWYAEGAEVILKRQSGDGDWRMLYDTSYAICFLAKGRAPILFNKLQFKGQWNNHPRDVANLAAYVAAVKEQPIRWQVINLEAPVPEWHDAPILYITAETALNFTPQEKRKLRQFTDTGGTILFEASCGNPVAADSWRALAKDVWPEWEMERLAPEHPLFVADQVMTGRLPVLYGMDDGLRTFAFVSFSDISCPWNTMAIAKQRPLFVLGGNLYLYATDRRPLRARLAQTRSMTRTSYVNARLRAGPRAALKAVRVKHGGDWYLGRNYDPLGRLAEQLAPSAGLKITQGEPVEPSGLAAAGAQVAHITGRRGVNLNDAEAAALKQYLAGGGLMLAEAVMGDPAFDTEFRKLAAQLGLELKELAKDDPLLTGMMTGAAGYDVTSVGYKYALRVARMGKPLPLVYALTLDGKPAGLYSPFDLSFSQTGCDAWDCRGYEREDALALLTNVFLLFSTR